MRRIFVSIGFVFFAVQYVLGQGASCATAPAIASNSSCIYSAFSVSAGNSGVGLSSCVSSVQDDGWYQFTATGIFTNIQISNASDNIAFVVYSGTCGSLLEVACADQGVMSASALFSTLIGSTYFVRIIRTSSGSGSTTGDICLLGSSTCVLATLLDERFENPPIVGAITANIYGSGSSNHNAAMIRSGARFGWFNTKNGVGPVDVYDRQVNGLCVGIPVDVTFWTRESFGNMSATYSIIDDNANVLATTSLILTSTYQQITYNFIASTPGLRFVIRCNEVGGNGIDIAVEDILITQCCPTIVLPTELVDFRADCKEGDHELSWHTASEINLDYFSIEQSANGKDFTPAGKLTGTGSSRSSQSYSWTNTHLQSQEVYYRLKQVDLNGSSAYSSTVYLACESVTDYTSYPNPSSGKITINNKYSKIATFEICDVLGRRLSSVPTEILAEGRQLLVDLSGFENGIYFLKINNNTKKIIKK